MQAKDAYDAINTFKITLDPIPPFHDQLHLTVIGDAVPALVYPGNQSCQFLSIRLLLADNPFLPLIIGGSADIDCFAKLI